MKKFSYLVDLTWGYFLAYCLLLAAGGFSERQCAVLSLVGPLALVLYWTVIEKPEFTPFWVRIEPKWDQLFAEIGIDMEDMARKREECGQPGLTCDPFIQFVVLGRKLLYSTSGHQFFCKLDIRVEAYATDKHVSLRRPHFAPTFYVMERFDRHRRTYRWEFGWITEESSERRTDFDDESILIPLASIPKDFFYHDDRLWSDRKEARLEKQLNQLGWNRGVWQDLWELKIFGNSLILIRP
jgi:hypothetical protein